jgi:hypothetical protein
MATLKKLFKKTSATLFSRTQNSLQPQIFFGLGSTPVHLLYCATIRLSTYGDNQENMYIHEIKICTYIHEIKISRVRCQARQTVTKMHYKLLRVHGIFERYKIP